MIHKKLIHPVTAMTHAFGMLFVLVKIPEGLR